MNEFLNMGGYAAFVWPSYILAGALMLGLLLHSIASWRSQEALLNNLKKLADKKTDRRASNEESAQ